MCLKCFQDEVLENGVDLNHAVKNQTLSGMSFCKSDLEAHGFEIVDGWDDVGIGMGYVGNYDIDTFFKRLDNTRKIYLRDKIVVIDYGSMAIGGLGGYITLWAKDRPVPQEFMFRKQTDKVCGRCGSSVYLEPHYKYAAYPYVCLNNNCRWQMSSQEAINRPLLTTSLTEDE